MYNINHGKVFNDWIPYNMTALILTSSLHNVKLLLHFVFHITLTSNISVSRLNIWNIHYRSTTGHFPEILQVYIKILQSTFYCINQHIWHWVNFYCNCTYIYPRTWPTITTVQILSIQYKINSVWITLVVYAHKIQITGLHTHFESNKNSVITSS